MVGFVKTLVTSPKNLLENIIKIEIPGLCPGLEGQIPFGDLNS